MGMSFGVVVQLTIHPSRRPTCKVEDTQSFSSLRPRHPPQTTTDHQQQEQPHHHQNINYNCNCNNKNKKPFSLSYCPQARAPVSGPFFSPYFTHLTERRYMSAVKFKKLGLYKKVRRMSLFAQFRYFHRVGRSVFSPAFLTVSNVAFSMFNANDSLFVFVAFS